MRSLVITGWVRRVLGSLVVLVLCLIPAAQAVGSPPSAVDLGTVGGFQSITSSYRSAVLNDAGQVVGMSTDISGEWHAFSWTRGGGMVDLGLGRSNAVNASGQVVGQSDWHAFSWTQEGGKRDLHTLSGSGVSSAVAVNDAGWVVGSRDTRALLWTPEGGVTDLGALGDYGSEAVAVNTAGQVAGNSGTPTSYRHAFLWTHEEGMVDLGTLPGGNVATAIAMNDAGQIVGYASTHEYLARDHAFVWDRGTLTDLGTLGGDRSAAMDINASGQVAGYSTIESGEFHAVLWTEGRQIDLGTLGGAESYASAVNDAGKVVGHSTTASGDRHAFAWTQEEGMVDLGTLGGRESFASAVNTAGDVAGYASLPEGNVHAVLWLFTGDWVAPEITVPADKTVPATSPAGTTVDFEKEVWAVDAVEGAVPVTCTPASGSMFPIGDTPVTCSAADTAGNTATAAFTVHVKGATEQLADLKQAVEGVGPGKSLAVKVGIAERFVAHGKNQAACMTLTAFNLEVRALSGKKIPPQQAASLRADANRIKNVLGC